jgi:hypothetical protein
VHSALARQVEMDLRVGTGGRGGRKQQR